MPTKKIFNTFIKAHISYIENYYKVNFAMMQHHKDSLTELDNMIPWEREIYVQMLVDYIREENERQKNQQS